MARDFTRKHDFVPMAVGTSWCDATDEAGHLCGRIKAHALHQPRKPRIRHTYLDLTGTPGPDARHCYRCPEPRSAHLAS